MAALPTGTVTFLFTDIEGSTRLLQRLGDRYAEVLAEYRRLLRAAVQERGGQEVDTQGDAFFFAFPRARDAVAAAIAAQQSIVRRPWPDGVAVHVRMGLHTGEALTADTGYVGIDVHRVARVCAAAHGGQILVSEATHVLVGDDIPGRVSLRDLGEHRLKDLARPQRMFQVVATGLPDDFPPLRSVDILPNNLPRQLSSFVGRKPEMADVRRLLVTASLVTLTGAGGAGKTRLAIQVAAHLLDEFPDGVWLVELAPLSDPALVPKAVALALDVPEQPGRQVTETVVAFLCSKHLLLLLDNCEHVLSACQDLADVLLRASPNLRILATSREALGVEGESAYRVPSLQLPDPQRLPALARLAECEAVQLFVERAALSQPSFTLTASNAPTVVQICHRLDGIPLAIEFAAARVKVLSVDQIAARLDDRFRLLTTGRRKSLPRHQTLRATMDWSFDLLSEQERTVLRRLSVFAGGWTLEAAEAICSGNGVKSVDILDLLTQLVDKSLVGVETQGGEARYQLLETVRQYGRDRLAESGEAAEVLSGHRDWYLALAERAEPELTGPREITWLERLEVEHDNLRAALEWSRTEGGGPEAGLRLAGALWRFWYVRGYWMEGRRWLQDALARSSEAPVSVLPKAIHGAAFLARRHADYAWATPWCEKGLALSRELGDKKHAAWFLIHFGLVALKEGDYRRAASQFEEALALSREIGDKELSGVSVMHLGIVARSQGDYDRANACYTETLALWKEVGYFSGVAFSLRNLGILALRQGDVVQARTQFREGLILSRTAGEDRRTIEECLDGMAQVACVERNHDRAVRLFGAAEALREALGLQRLAIDQVPHDQCVGSTRAELGETVFEAAWAEGRAMTLEQAIEYALTGETG